MAIEDYNTTEEKAIQKCMENYKVKKTDLFFFILIYNSYTSNMYTSNLTTDELWVFAKYRNLKSYESIQKQN